MKRIIIVILMLVLTFTVKEVTIGYKSSSQNMSTTFNTVDCPGLVELMKGNRLDKTLDPDMKTMQEVRKFRKDCETACDDISDLYTRGGWTKALDYNLKIISLHLQFNSNKNKIIALDDRKYAVFRKLRQSIHLKPPVGFAFVRIGEPKEADSLSKVTELGNTYLTRYVTMEVKDQRFDGVLSHELAHVYINALSGLPNLGKLPKWFNEGSALYFAQNKPREVISTESGGSDERMTSFLPQNYQNYLLVFKYLSSIKGKNAFEKFVTNSISTHSVQQPLNELTGKKSFDELVIDAKHWKNINSLRVICYILIAFCVIWIVGDMLKANEYKYSYHIYYDEFNIPQGFHHDRKRYEIKRVVCFLLLLSLAAFTFIILPNLR